MYLGHNIILDTGYVWSPMGYPCRGLANLGSLARVGDEAILSVWRRRARKGTIFSILHLKTLNPNLLCHEVIAKKHHFAVENWSLSIYINSPFFFSLFFERIDFYYSLYFWENRFLLFLSIFERIDFYYFSLYLREFFCY